MALPLALDSRVIQSTGSGLDCTTVSDDHVTTKTIESLPSNAMKHRSYRKRLSGYEQTMRVNIDFHSKIIWGLIGLCLWAGCASSGLIPAKSSHQSKGTKTVERTITIKVIDPAGKAVPKDAIGELYLLDEDWNPIPNAEAGRSDGLVTFRPITTSHTVAFSYKMEVPEFGRFVFYADNGGSGYDLKGIEILELDILQELAHSRLLNAEKAAQAYKETGALSQETTVRLGRARSAWETSKTVEGAERYGAFFNTLREAGLGSESLAVETAKYEISHFEQPRTDFHFGAGAFLNRSNTPERNAVVERFATDISVPFYGWAGADPAELSQFTTIDDILKWAYPAGLHVKGEPLFWMHTENGPPDEYKDLPAELMMNFAEFRVRNIVSAFRGQIRTWHVIEEAHDWANAYGYSQDELIAITQACVLGAKKADPSSVAIVNCSHLRGEYRLEKDRTNAPAMTPYQYLQRCINAEIPFDAIGLKMPYMDMDLFECKRLLDRYARLGKPLRITYFEVPNSGESMAWHGVWNEELQAEFVEAFATIAYAHPSVFELTYRNLIEPTFPRNMGIVRDDFTPLPAFERLMKLRESWMNPPLAESSQTAEPNTETKEK